MCRPPPPKVVATVCDIRRRPNCAPPSMLGRPSKSMAMPCPAKTFKSGIVTSELPNFFRKLYSNPSHSLRTLHNRVHSGRTPVWQITYASFGILCDTIQFRSGQTGGFRFYFEIKKDVYVTHVKWPVCTGKGPLDGIVRIIDPCVSCASLRGVCAIQTLRI